MADEPKMSDEELVDWLHEEFTERQTFQREYEETSYVYSEHQRERLMQIEARLRDKGDAADAVLMEELAGGLAAADRHSYPLDGYVPIALDEKRAKKIAAALRQQPADKGVPVEVVQELVLRLEKTQSELVHAKRHLHEAIDFVATDNSAALARLRPYLEQPEPPQ